MDARNRLLADWGRFVANAARQGALTGGNLVSIARIETVAGPRAGALEIRAGLDAGRLLRALSKDDAATLRQFVPWSFTGEPQVFMAGRFVRCEAGWPDHLAETMIRLGDLGQYPKRAGRWHVGKNEQGQKVTAVLDDDTPHFLVSGATGSGKSVALRSAVLQLSADPGNRLVLIDGKYGESLSQVAHLPGVVGPVAIEGPSVRAALGWTCQEMRQRYEAGQYQGRVIVIFDEIQEFIDDRAIVGLLKKIVAQGRAAGVHCLLATQHPTVDAFGDASTRRNLTGKLALRVDDPDASRVAVGGRLPRADYLLGCGDAYAVRPGACYRTQVAYVDHREIGQANGSQHTFDEWPEFEAESAGHDPPTRGKAISHVEIGASLISAMEGEGRPAFKARIEAAGLSRPGSDRARTLLALGRKVCDWLESQDVGLCYLDDDGGGWEIETC